MIIDIFPALTNNVDINFFDQYCKIDIFTIGCYKEMLANLHVIPFPPINALMSYSAKHSDKYVVAHRRKTAVLGSLEYSVRNM